MVTGRRSADFHAANDQRFRFAADAGAQSCPVSDVDFACDGGSLSERAADEPHVSGFPRLCGFCVECGLNNLRLLQ